MLFQQLDKIDAVNKADIRRVANQVFTAKNRTYALIEYAAEKAEKPAPDAPAQPAAKPAPSTQGGR
jgi:predicted Zn-dependent peptidase